MVIDMKSPMIIVCILLGIGATSMLVVIWLILKKLPEHLESKAYKFIFTGKILWFLMCIGGIYLIIWPLPKRTVIVQLIWFSTMSAASICSAIGYWIYSRDVNAVLQSDAYQAPLPAKPPTDTELHESKDKREGGKEENSTMAPKT